MKWMSVVVLVGVLAAAGCSRNSRNSADRSITGSDLERIVKAKFAAEPSIPSGVGVRADAGQNRITLSGTVPSEDVRNTAVELAKSSGPAATVIDRLQVEPEQIARTDYNEGTAKVDREKAKQLGDSVGDSLDDSWIHSTIIRKLLRDPETPVANIHVDVQKGVVTLRGKVGSTDQKAEAQRVAQNIDGVKRVNNRIKVKA